MSSLKEFFIKLERENWSGEVAVSSSEGSAFLLVRNGQLLWAHRSLDRSVERFRKIPWVKIPPEPVIRTAKTWEELIQALLQVNQTNYQRLVRYLKTERLEIFFRIFFWSNVEMTPRAFQVEVPDQVELGFYGPRKLGTLLKEAQRRIEEWPRFQKMVGSSKRIFVRQVEIPELSEASLDEIDKAFADGQIDEVSISGLPYSPEEIEILKLCDGTHALNDLIRLSIDGEFLTLRRLISLWEKGAIAPKDEESVVFRRAVPKDRFKFQDVARGLVLTLVFCGVGLAAGRLGESRQAHCPSDVPLQQALQVFKKSQGRYPLTLTELKSQVPLSQDYLQHFEYKLLHPLQYELVIK